VSFLRFLLLLCCAAVLGYAALLMLMYLQQRSLLFYPQFTQPPGVAVDFEFPVDGALLRGWVVNPGQADALLYFGGNAEDVSLNLDEMRRLFPRHTVYLVAYRGYGHSTGLPSEAALAADAIALFDHAAGAHAAVDVLGRSLGSGVGVHVAAVRPVRRLGLITPFDSILAVGQAHYPLFPLRWLMKDPFESVLRATTLAMPVLVVIAGQDTVIPPAHAEALAAALPQPPTVVYLPDAQHSNVQVFPAYDEALQAFFEDG